VTVMVGHQGLEPEDRRAMYREDIERSAFGNEEKKDNEP